MPAPHDLARRIAHGDNGIALPDRAAVDFEADRLFIRRQCDAADQVRRILPDEAGVRQLDARIIVDIGIVDRGVLIIEEQVQNVRSARSGIGRSIGRTVLYSVAVHQRKSITARRAHQITVRRVHSRPAALGREVVNAADVLRGTQHLVVRIVLGDGLRRHVELKQIRETLPRGRIRSPPALRESRQHVGRRFRPARTAVDGKLRRPGAGRISKRTRSLVIAPNIQGSVLSPLISDRVHVGPYIERNIRKRHVMVDIAVANPQIHVTRRDTGSCNVFERVTVGGNRLAREVERVVLNGGAVARAKLDILNGNEGLLVRSDKGHNPRVDRSRKLSARFLPGVGHLAGEFHEIRSRRDVFQDQHRIPVRPDQVLTVARGAFPPVARHRDRIFDVAAGILPRLGGGGVTAALHAPDMEGIVRIGIDVDIFVRGVAQDGRGGELP